MRKARSDAWHAGMTIRQLDQVFTWCGETDGYAGAAGRVKQEFGRSPSVTALSNWYQTWPLQRAFLTAGSVAERIKEAARDLPNLDIKPEQVEQLGQTAFMIDALSRMDRDTFFEARRSSQRDRELAQVERRIVLLEKKAAQADAAENIARSELTPEEKQAKMREIFGLPGS